MSEKEYIEICKTEIEKILVWKNSLEWSHSDFEELSVLIEKETKILISINTLKRIWGKMKYDGIPNVSTKNALSKFIGYSNWKEFCLNSSKSQKRKGFFKKPFAKYLMLLIFISLLFFLSFLQKHIYNKSDQEKLFDTSLVSFKVKENSSNVPFSVTFEYDVSKINADSIWIKHVWNPKDMLDKTKHIHTILHFFPDYYCPELYADGQLLKKVCYHALSNHWIYIYPSSSWEPRLYLRVDSLNTGYMQLSPKIIKAKQLNMMKENNWVTYHNSQDYGISADNLVFKTRVKNNIDEGGFTCQECQIGLCGTENMSRIRFAQEGCIKNARIKVGGLIKDGINYDLSNMKLNLDEWREVKLSFQNRLLEIFVNNKLVRSENYDDELGDLKAVKIGFRGCGKVDYVILETPEGKEVYKDVF